MTTAEETRSALPKEPALPRGGLELLFALTVFAILPHAYQPDVVKPPLLIGGSVILLGFGVRAITRGRAVTFPPSSVAIPLLLFCLFASGLSLRAVDQQGARNAALLWSAYGLCFLFGCAAFVAEKDVDRFFMSLSLIALIVSVIGVLQMTPSGVPGIVFMTGDDGRVPSTLGNPSVLGGFSSGLLPIALVSVWRSTGARRALHAAAAFGLTIMALASGSRGGIIAACGGLTALAFLTRRDVRKTGIRVGWILGVATLFVLLLPPLREMLLGFVSGERGVSIARRLVIWESGWNAFLDAPWSGHGTGSFVTVLPFFRDPLYWRNGTEDLVFHAHNEVLELGVEFGIAGVALWGIIVLSSLLKGIRHARRANGSGMIAAALTAGLLGILLDNLTGVSLRHPPVGALAWMFMGMLWSGYLGRSPPFVLAGKNGARRAAGLTILAAAVIWSGLYVSRHFPRFSSEQHMLDGILAATGGNTETAGRELIEAARVDSGNLQALSAAAPVWLLRREPVHALNAVDVLHRRAPFFPRSHLVRAQALVMLGRVAEADSAVARELRLRRTPETLLFLARMARAAGDSIVARAAEEEARALATDGSGR